MNFRGKYKYIKQCQVKILLIFFVNNIRSNPSVKKILILSSDYFFAGKLEQQLNQLGCEIALVDSWSKIYRQLEQTHFSMIIIDDVEIQDSLDLIEFISSETLNTKTVFITEQYNSKNYIQAFLSGVDECICKSLDLAEIVLRIIRLFSLHKSEKTSSIKVKSIELFPDSGILLIEGRRKLIRKRESQILDCLIRYRNNVVTRNTLIKTVWGCAEIPTYTTVDVYIRRIRLLLPDPKLITTVRGFGYMIKD